MMRDTAEEVRAKQLEIIFSMSAEQRFMEGIRMIEDVRFIVGNSISEQFPGINEKQFQIELIKRYY